MGSVRHVGIWYVVRKMQALLHSGRPGVWDTRMPGTPRTPSKWKQLFPISHFGPEPSSLPGNNSESLNSKEEKHSYWISLEWVPWGPMSAWIMASMVPCPSTWAADIYWMNCCVNLQRCRRCTFMHIFTFSFKSSGIHMRKARGSLFFHKKPGTWSC